MKLAQLIRDHGANLLTKDPALLPSQRGALQAILRCRTPTSGNILAECPECRTQQTFFLSCGHRHCPRCQNYETTQWLERQCDKLLPVPYFLTTFTLPAQLRTQAYAHQRIVYNALFRAGVEALRALAGDPKRLDGMMGMTGVLHTHSRRLDYHPHVHFIIPGGGLNRKGNRWKKANPRFLVWVKNLSRIFRGKFLAILIEKGVNFPRVLTQIDWVVHCKPVGSGERALEYLARYLYRGVVREEALTQNPDGSITLRYIDSSTDEPKTRNFQADAFLQTYLKHTLPKGFRRARDYGFLHGRNRQLLVKLQLLLAVRLKRRPAQPRPRFCCPKCDSEMSILAIHRHTTPLPIRGSPHAA